MMFHPVKMKNYALKKDNYISISINTMSSAITNSPKKEEVKKDSITPIEKIKPNPKTIESIKEVDISDLFSDIVAKDIKNINIKQKKHNPRKLDELRKKIKTVKDNSVKSFAQKIKNFGDIKESKENTKASSGDEVNEYLAKINALVYQYFHPPQNSQGHSVKALIELSAIGKVKDFRILNFSSNENLNNECKKIKSRLMSVVFPINPQNRSSITIVKLTSKE